MLVEGEEGATAQDDLCHLIALDGIRGSGGKTVGVDDPLDRLHRDRRLAGPELEPELLAGGERRGAKPEQCRMQHVRELWRVLLMARDLAALDEERPVEGDPDGLTRHRARRLWRVPGFQALDPRQLVRGREQ